jgi:hypothetical protein
LKVRSFFTKDTVFLACLFSLILVLFKTAFKFNFFNDDFYLLRISHPTGLTDILHFFYPLKSYGFYRPISIEIFYSLINYFSRTPFLGYILSFATYFVGLTFLYFSLKIVFPQKIFLTRSATFIYAIHFTHVFQLLWLAAYQEIALFTFLCAAFFFALGKSVKSFFVCYLIALMSREQAVLLPLFLLIFFLSKKAWRERRPILVGSFLIVVAFFVIYILNYCVFVGCDS